MRRSTLATLAILLTVGLIVGACAGGAAQRGLDTFGSAGGGDAGGNPVPAAGPETGTSLEYGTDATGRTLAIRDDAKIIRTGSLALQVDDVAKAIGDGRAAIDALGGYVGASRESNHDDQPNATITYRIPVDRWDDALTALRGHARKVVEESTDAVEVTDQLVDLAARVRNLRASEDALLAIAARAEKISDVLEVQARLTEVRGQIEQLEAQRTSLQDRVAFATLDVTYGVEVAAVKAAAKGFSPTDEVDRASAQLIDVLQGVAAAGIWFAIVWLPILLVFIVVTLVMIRVLRRMGIRAPSANPATGWGTPPTPPTAPAGD